MGGSGRSRTFSASTSGRVADITNFAEEVAARLHRLRLRNAETLRRVRRRVSKDLATEDARTVIDLAAELLQTRAPGSHVVAYELILHHPKALAAIRARDLRRLGRTLASWGEVDTFACYVAGRAWRAGQVADAVIARWAGSSDRWWRRAALVSTVPLNVRAQGGSGDAKRTLAVCRLLIDDRDDMVVKAMSWALRALVKPARDAVATFVDRYEGSLAPRVVREVRNKLRTGRKAQLRETTLHTSR